MNFCLFESFPSPFTLRETIVRGRSDMAWARLGGRLIPCGRAGRALGLLDRCPPRTVRPEKKKKPDGFEGTRVERSGFTYLSFFLVACGVASGLVVELLHVCRCLLAGLAGSAIAWSVSKLSEASIVLLGAAPALVVLPLIPLSLRETGVRGLSIISKFISGGRGADQSRCFGNH
jgi:hypothetical protein